MQNKKNAIVILYTGDELPDYVAGKIVEQLATSGVTIPEMVKLIYKDEQEITNVMIKEHPVEAIKVEEHKESTDYLAEAIKQAVVYIGKRFEGSLTNTNGNYIAFAMQLAEALSEERINGSFNILSPGDKTPLHTAVEVLSKNEYVIPKPLARKYHFTQQVIETIKIIYKRFF